MEKLQLIGGKILTADDLERMNEEEIKSRKKKYIQITHSGSRAIQTIEDAKEFIDSIEEYEVYAFRVVYLTEKEFENLPEFTGF